MFEPRPGQVIQLLYGASSHFCSDSSLIAVPQLRVDHRTTLHAFAFLTRLSLNLVLASDQIFVVIHRPRSLGLTGDTPALEAWLGENNSITVVMRHPRCDYRAYQAGSFIHLALGLFLRIDFVLILRNLFR